MRGVSRAEHTIGTSGGSEMATKRKKAGRKVGGAKRKAKTVKRKVARKVGAAKRKTKASAKRVKRKVKRRV